MYGVLIKLLNLGMHYQDSYSYRDSKMYTIIRGYFIRYYEQCARMGKDGCLAEHLRQFLVSVLTQITLDHALIALLGIFI